MTGVARLKCCKDALVILTFAMLFASRAFAQYQPIPNYGPGGAVEPDQPTNGGYFMRQAINGRFSGSVPISPQLVHLNFSQLPSTVTNGQVYYLNDGAPGTPCKGGGGGAIAIGVANQWMCTPIAIPIANVIGFGATGNCGPPDDNSIQMAIDAQPINVNDGTNPVYLPATQGVTGSTTTKCYLLSKPLVLDRGGIRLYGDGREQTFVTPNYYGPVLLAGTDTLSLSSALLSGGGNAVNLTSTPFLELSMLLQNHLSGHSAFSIEFELNVPASPSNSVILQSAYDWPYQSYARAGATDTGAFNINYQSSSPHLSFSATLSTSGLVATTSANNSVSVSGNHAIGFYYDGAHLWNCVDGASSTPVAATGTWVQSKWESITLPDQYGNGPITWPDGAGGAGVSNDSFNGKIDNLRISNVARSTSGTCPAVPTTKFVYDANTDLLLNGLSCADGSQYCLESGTGQYAVYAQSQFAPGSGVYASAVNGVWFPVLGQGGTFTAHNYVHDLALGWSQYAQGAYILQSPFSQFERIAAQGEHNGLNFYYNDYENTVREARMVSTLHNGYQGFEWGSTSNSNNVENIAAEEAFVCFNLESAKTTFEEKSGHCLVNGETAIGWLVDLASGTLIDPFLDQESADTMLAPIYYKGASAGGALMVTNGNLDTYGGAPFVIHDAAGQGPVIMHGTLLNNIDEDQAAGAAIQFPGFESFSTIIGTVWQGQASIAASPTIANVPGTCAGSGGDTNCAKFIFPSVVQFSVNTASAADSAGTGTVLGVANFTGSQGTFSSGATFANTYSLFSGQLYLLKGTNLLNLYTSGGFEFKITGTTNTVDTYDASNAGNVTVDAVAPSAGFYNFQLSYGAPSGATHAIITPAQTPANQVPATPDLLQDVTFMDSNVPLSNEIGNQHVVWTQQTADGYPLGHIGQVERYIP
jgi:hypothetical protein